MRDGNGWIVNGQKVCSSWAHLTDYGLLLARTDPTVPKHKGLTFFVVDMKTPGITVRPIRQISGASDFNETFMVDAHLPDDCRIGAVGEGWACAMTLLMGERLNQAGEGHVGRVARVIEYARATRTAEGTMLDDGATRLALAEAHAEEHAQNMLLVRLRTMLSRGENPGAMAAIMKLAYSNRLQKIAGLAMELRGAAGIARRADDAVTAQFWSNYIWSSALRIAGGADEVLRNQIAERLFGMPGEMRARSRRAVRSAEVIASRSESLVPGVSRCRYRFYRNRRS